MIKPGTPVWVSDKSQKEADKGGDVTWACYYLCPSTRSTQHFVENKRGIGTRWRYVCPVKEKPPVEVGDFAKAWDENEEPEDHSLGAVYGWVSKVDIVSEIPYEINNCDSWKHARRYDPKEEKK